MATTTNYSWSTPDNTAYVKDGASAIRTLGSSVDTTLFTALGGAYPGLRLIKTQTVGSAVSSVQVTAAFSATYDNYKIVYTGGTSSVSSIDLRLTLGAATANYYGGLVYNRPNAGTPAGIPNNNTAFWQYGAGLASSNGIISSFELYAPFLSARTGLYSQVIDLSGVGGALGTFAGFHDSATSYSTFTLTPAGGTITGGTIYVYGYGKS